VSASDEFSLGNWGHCWVSLYGKFLVHICLGKFHCVDDGRNTG